MKLWKILKQFNLKERLGNNTGDSGGKFLYIVGTEKFEIRWDAAGLDSEQRLSIIEEESNQISDIHIHGHLMRILFMQLLGEDISKLIWIVNLKDFRKLKSIINCFESLLSKQFTFKLPYMCFVTPEAEIIFDKRNINKTIF